MTRKEDCTFFSEQKHFGRISDSQIMDSVHEEPMHTDANAQIKSIFLPL